MMNTKWRSVEICWVLNGIGKLAVENCTIMVEYSGWSWGSTSKHIHPNKLFLVYVYFCMRQKKVVFTRTSGQTEAWKLSVSYLARRGNKNCLLFGMCLWNKHLTSVAARGTWRKQVLTTCHLTLWHADTVKIFMVMSDLSEYLADAIRMEIRTAMVLDICESRGNRVSNIAKILKPLHPDQPCIRNQKREYKQLSLCQAAEPSRKGGVIVGTLVVIICRFSIFSRASFLFSSSKPLPW